MKNLITTIDLNCSVFNNVTPYFGKVKGVISSITIDLNNQLIVTYQYQKEDSTPLMSSLVTYNLEEQEYLYKIIKDELNVNQNPTLVLSDACYFGFQIEMAKTFGITTNQIEICK